MAKCKTCGKEYHACSSCGLQNWEYDYCNSKCWEADWTNQINVKIVMELIDSMTNEQIQALYDLDDDGIGRCKIEAKMEEKLGRKLW